MIFIKEQEASGFLTGLQGIKSSFEYISGLGSKGIKWMK